MPKVISRETRETLLVQDEKRMFQVNRTNWGNDTELSVYEIVPNTLVRVIDPKVIDTIVNGLSTSSQEEQEVQETPVAQIKVRRKPGRKPRAKPETAQQ